MSSAVFQKNNNWPHSCFYFPFQIPHWLPCPLVEMPRIAGIVFSGTNLFNTLLKEVHSCIQQTPGTKKKVRY